jgi:CheY-like chemotaxis protein
MKERSDKYYLEKFKLTEEQLADYKKQKEEIGDPDLIIEDLIEPEMTLGLSLSAKISYLEKLRNKVITILYLIEQQKENPEINPDNYLQSLLFDVNAANLLFEDQLSEVIIKLFGISTTYKNSAHNVIRKQVLETRRLVDDLTRLLTNEKNVK